MDRLESIKRHFDGHAAKYHNPVTDAMGAWELDVIRDLVPAGARLLDYGCGSGRSALDFIRRGCDVTAYDVSREMLAIARERADAEGKTAAFTTDEATLAGRRWPVVTAIGVFDYYPDALPLLGKLTGYLEPGGRLVLTFPNALSPLGWVYGIASRFTYPATLRTPAAVRSLAASAGLGVEALRFAAPAVRPFGHLVVASLIAAPAAAVAIEGRDRA